MSSKLDWSIFNYNNIHTLDFRGANYLVFYPRKQFIDFYLPSFIKGDTYDQLMRYLLTFIYLNPDQNEDVYKQVLTALHTNCQNKISDKRIQELFDEAILLKDDKDLETVVLQANALKKSSYKGYTINPAVPKDKKHSVKAAARGEFRRTRTKGQIETVLENWNPYWGKPTNKLIAEKAKLSTKQVNTYLPLLKEERKKAASIQKPKPANKTFQRLWNTLLNWDENLGKPTNKNLSKITGIRLSTIEVYSPKLKGIKAGIKKNKTTFFDAFDSKGFVNNETEETDGVQNDLIMDLQFEGIGFDEQLGKVA